MKMIQDVHQFEHNIIIFVSHNMADVAALADKVLVMDRGMDFFGTIEDYRARFAEGAVTARG